MREKQVKKLNGAKKKQAKSNNIEEFVAFVKNAGFNTADIKKLLDIEEKTIKDVKEYYDRLFAKKHVTGYTSLITDNRPFYGSKVHDVRRVWKKTSDLMYGEVLKNENSIAGLSIDELLEIYKYVYPHGDEFLNLLGGLEEKAMHDISYITRVLQINRATFYSHNDDEICPVQDMNNVLSKKAEDLYKHKVHSLKTFDHKYALFMEMAGLSDHNIENGFRFENEYFDKMAKYVFSSARTIPELDKIVGFCSIKFEFWDKYKHRLSHDEVFEHIDSVIRIIVLGKTNDEKINKSIDFSKDIAYLMDIVENGDEFNLIYDALRGEEVVYMRMLMSAQEDSFVEVFESLVDREEAWWKDRLVSISLDRFRVMQDMIHSEVVKEMFNEQWVEKSKEALKKKNKNFARLYRIVHKNIRHDVLLMWNNYATNTIFNLSMYELMCLDTTTFPRLDLFQKDSDIRPVWYILYGNIANLARTEQEIMDARKCIYEIYNRNIHDENMLKIVNKLDAKVEKNLDSISDENLWILFFAEQRDFLNNDRKEWLHLLFAKELIHRNSANFKRFDGTMVLPDTENEVTASLKYNRLFSNVVSERFDIPNIRQQYRELNKIKINK